MNRIGLDRDTRAYDFDGVVIDGRLKAANYFWPLTDSI